MHSPQDLEACSNLLERWKFRCLIGPTASGKTELSLRVAERTGAEVLSLDALTVYRGLDIGTAKPGPDERTRVPHHMLDLVGPEERFDVQRYLAELEPVLADLERRGVRGLFVGGTAFYLQALTRGLYQGPPADHELRAELVALAEELGPEAFHTRLADVDPRSAERLHPNDTKRTVRALEVYRQTGRPLSDWQVEWGWHAPPKDARDRRLAGLELSVPELDARIAARTAAMLDAGWVEEALRIRSGPGFGETARTALGYREVLQLADGELDRAACIERIVLKTRQFARKQRTWYRKFDDVLWLQPAAPDALEAQVGVVLEHFGWS